MKRFALASLLVFPSSFLMAQTDTEFKPITSNNYLSAGSSVNQSFGAWAKPHQNLDITSIWFNPAMMAYQGQQSSINLLNQPSGSIFFTAYNQNVGVHLGRTSEYTSDIDDDSGVYTEIDSYDLFWSKGKKGDSIGVNAYFSFDGSTDVARTNFDDNADDNDSIALQGTSTVIIDDGTNTIEVVVDDNRAGSSEFDFGANIGFDKGLKQYVINLEVSESTGIFSDFQAEKTDSLGNLESISTVGTGESNMLITLGGSYIQKKDDGLFIIAGAKLVQELNSTSEYSQSSSGDQTDTAILHTKQSNNSTNVNLTGGVQLEIKPSPRIKYSIQQLLNLGIGLGKIKLDIIKESDGSTVEATGLEEYSKTTDISFNAPILIAMKMQASKKLNMTASVQTNALSLSSSKETDIEMDINDDGDTWEETGNEGVTKNEFFRQTTSNTTVAWGVSYQISEKLVFDFNTSSDFLTSGFTDSALVNEITITYQF